MAETVLPGVEVSVFFLESFVPLNAEKAAPHLDALGLYLIDLMQAQGYRVVSGVAYEMLESEVCPYPSGWGGVRAMIQVQEFDAELDL